MQVEAGPILDVREISVHFLLLAEDADVFADEDLVGKKGQVDHKSEKSADQHSQGNQHLLRHLQLLHGQSTEKRISASRRPTW